MRNWREVYTYACHTSSDGHIHLWLERWDGKPIRCGWDTLQAIKNEICGEEVCLVEVFPAQNNVVNEVNRRHFWSLPPGVQVGFSK